jgi:hypothetical protein
MVILIQGSADNFAPSIARYLPLKSS